ncbi:biotin carboxyl carrier protein [Thalassoporum mexicanum PCC 7367]|uniref:acetyl-CoA carboxylase biotin carboxyl carrier protein n=1 Tax=Thalassoporum mexicanum TaxID=3457544 RepID=UPI00029FB833|nr:acetyl-CoA carboxylase biotin carboxyl carrier protein [Pseudanabaena sp. PCC 7367]AFY70387.1 biotin carboxyl carrier protein [Pseudanabaena sp. PCC 7367]
MEFSLEQLRELIKILDQTDISELTLESGDLRLNIRKNDQKMVQVAPIATAPAIEMAANIPVAAPPAATPPAPEPEVENNWEEITSPMVGTFYRAPAPGEPAFAEVGDPIGKGQTVCIIEAMKLMNEIESEVSGKIVEILVDNAQPVEYGQVLMRIDPGSSNK